MYLSKNVLMKIGSTCHHGILKGLDFEVIHSMSEKDISGEEVYMDLYKYFEFRSIDKRFADIIKQRYKAEEILVLKPISNNTSWKKKNEKCLLCTNSCKQSIMVSIYYCKKYDEKG